MLYKVIKRCDDRTRSHPDVSKAKFHPIVFIYFVFLTPILFTYKHNEFVVVNYFYNLCCS